MCKSFGGQRVDRSLDGDTTGTRNHSLVDKEVPVRVGGPQGVLRASNQDVSVSVQSRGHIQDHTLSGKFAEVEVEPPMKIYGQFTSSPTVTPGLNTPLATGLGIRTPATDVVAKFPDTYDCEANAVASVKHL